MVHNGGGSYSCRWDAMFVSTGQIVKGLGANKFWEKVLRETFCEKRFERNVLRETFWEKCFERNFWEKRFGQVSSFETTFRIWVRGRGLGRRFWQKVLREILERNVLWETFPVILGWKSWKRSLFFTSGREVRIDGTNSETLPQTLNPKPFSIVSAVEISNHGRE